MDFKTYLGDRLIIKKEYAVQTNLVANTTWLSSSRHGRQCAWRLAVVAELGFIPWWFSIRLALDLLGMHVYFPKSFRLFQVDPKP